MRSRSGEDHSNFYNYENTNNCPMINSLLNEIKLADSPFMKSLKLIRLKIMGGVELPECEESNSADYSQELSAVFDLIDSKNIKNREIEMNSKDMIDGLLEELNQCRRQLDSCLQESNDRLCKINELNQLSSTLKLRLKEYEDYSKLHAVPRNSESVDISLTSYTNNKSTETEEFNSRESMLRFLYPEKYSNQRHKDPRESYSGIKAFHNVVSMPTIYESKLEERRKSSDNIYSISINDLYSNDKANRPSVKKSILKTREFCNKHKSVVFVESNHNLKSKLSSNMSDQQEYPNSLNTDASINNRALNLFTEIDDEFQDAVQLLKFENKSLLITREFSVCIYSCSSYNKAIQRIALIKELQAKLDRGKGLIYDSTISNENLSILNDQIAKVQVDFAAIDAELKDSQMSYQNSLLVLENKLLITKNQLKIKKNKK